MRTVPQEIRFYCLCGVKMRITSEMFGKPGKCVSCRQKFWVPSSEELPEDDTVIRLADHPELLRRAGERIRPKANAVGKGHSGAPILPPPEAVPEEVSKDSANGLEDLGGSAAEERLVSGADVVAGAEGEGIGVPLDDLEPLRQILAYQYLTEREVQDSASGKAAGRADTDTRESYRRVIERAKTRVEQRLRELLYDTGRQLSEALGEIAQTTLKFRVGELGPDAYFEVTARLRRRREWLERQRVNLKAWLRTRDVHRLGGPEGLTLEDMNLNKIEVRLPAEDKDDRPLLKRYVGELREAFDALMVAGRRRSEWRRMVREGELPTQALRDGPLRAGADAERAKARIAHARNRLRQVVKDCDTDISALQAYQQLLAKNMLPRRRGELSQEQLLAEAGVISRALADLRLWRNWASSAAHAEDPGDLPLSPPTIFRRLAEPNELRRFARESLPAYAAALCLMVLALLSVHALKAGFLAGMVLMVVIPAFSSRTRRGACYAALWIVESLFMGLAWRAAPQQVPADVLHLAAMTAASLGAWAAVGFAAAMVLRRLAGGLGWEVPTAGAAAGALFVLTVLFPQGGSPAGPSPSMVREASVTRNGRDIPAAPVQPRQDAATVPKPFSPKTPSAVSPPAAEPAKTVMALVTPVSPLPSPTVSPPSAAAAGPQNTPPERVVAQGLPAQQVPEGEEAARSSAASAVAPRPVGPAVELRGVMQKEGDLPRFRIVLTGTGARDRTMDIVLGETVYGPWKALEYSVATKKLTLSNGKRLVVLDTGETVDLPE